MKNARRLLTSEDILDLELVLADLSPVLQALIGSVTVQDEGVPLGGAPHSILNFVGGGITAADSGGGLTTVTVPAGAGGTFLLLPDTPGAFAGAALDILRVNAVATDVEFVDETSDFLTQYALLAGRTGGQTLIGGDATGNTLVLEGNSFDANASRITVGDSGNTTGIIIQPEVDDAEARVRFMSDATGDVTLRHLVQTNTYINWSGTPGAVGQLTLSAENYVFVRQNTFSGPRIDFNVNGLTINLLAADMDFLHFSDDGTRLFMLDAGVGGGAGGIGLHGATPQVQDTGWSVTSVVTTRTYDANTVTLAVLADVVGTLVETVFKPRGDIAA